MAIPDLLWACPECGEDRGLRADGPGYVCRQCETRFRRGRGAAIQAERPDGSRIIQSPAAWLDQLDDPETVVRQADTTDGVIRSARVRTRWVVDTDTVHGEDGYLNRIEIWGDDVPGRIELHVQRLVYEPDEADPQTWPLEALTAVQASSSSLQLNRTGAPLVSFRFDDDSIFLWEQLLHAALQAHYRETGRGEIQEFQPRIAVL